MALQRKYCRSGEACGHCGRGWAMWACPAGLREPPWDAPIGPHQAHYCAGVCASCAGIVHAADIYKGAAMSVWPRLLGAVR